MMPSYSILDLDKWVAFINHAFPQSIVFHGPLLGKDSFWKVWAKNFKY